MKVEGIISNPVTQEIKHKGHLSIRFCPDRFSLLVADASFRPVLLNTYHFDHQPAFSSHPEECEKVLEEMELMDFEGETVFVVDSPQICPVPAHHVDAQTAPDVLGKTARVEKGEISSRRHIRRRRMELLFAYPDGLDELGEKIPGSVNIIHAAECMLSLSDQIQASDHQRGFILAEVQNSILNLLIIRGDEVLLLNRFALKDTSDFIYHTLNCIKQLDLDRETIPLYLAGKVHPEHELYGLLRKYVRNVKLTPYYLEELTRYQLLRYMILSEGSKCV